MSQVSAKTVIVLELDIIQRLFIVLIKPFTTILVANII